MRTSLFLIFLLLFVLSCRKEEFIKDDYPVITTGSFDISDVKAFVLKSSDARLYKITDNSEIKRVKFVDKNMNPIFDTVRTYVTDITFLTRDFIVFNGSFFSVKDESNYPAVLFYKGDSGFYEFPDKIDKSQSFYYSLSTYFQKDNTGNVYFFNLRFPKNITRLSLTDYTSSDVLPLSHDNLEFLITGIGDCMYRSNSSPPEEGFFRVIFAEGGMEDFTISIPIDPEFIVEGMENLYKVNEGFWQGPDNEVYVLTSWVKTIQGAGGISEDHDVLDIYRISFVNKTINYELISTIEQNDLVEFISADRLNQYKAFKGDWVHFINKYNHDFIGVNGWAFNCKTGEVKVFNLPYREAVKGFDFSNNNLYLGFENDIIKMSIDTYSSISLLFGHTEKFFISKFTVTNDDIIFFEAVRYSDAKKVLGKIDNMGDVSIIDESFGGEIIKLVKLN